MKYLLITLGIILVIGFSYELDLISAKLDKLQTPTLEIYTPKNIYYVKGLNVTDEKSSLNIDFRDAVELKKFISNRTSQDVINQN